MKRTAFKNNHPTLRWSNTARKNRQGVFQIPPVYGIAAADHLSTIQTKLTVGSANDKYEQQADAMADYVIQHESALNPSLDEGNSNQQSQVQLKKASTPTFNASTQSAITAPTNVTQQLQTNHYSGVPLPAGTQTEMQGTFGADFTQVRVHTDQHAVGMNQALQARAFTHGSNIYFNQGQYNPRTKSGKHLLAHELTHVVQQKDSSTHIQRDPAIDAPNPEAEVRGLLQASEVSAALHYNLDRFANDEEIRVMRDVLGMNPNVSQLIDEEFVQAVAGWQASHNLPQIDGKLGPDTIRGIIAEYRAEAGRSPTMTGHANRLAIRTRPNQRSKNISVNGHADLFDAVLSHRDAELRLVMKVEFNFYLGSVGVVLSATKQTTFIRNFVRDVRRVWAGVYALAPAGSVPDNYLDHYFTDIRIIAVDSGGHYVVDIANTSAPYETSITAPNGPETDNTIGQMQMGDEDAGLYRGRSRPDSLGNSYPIRQYTVAHEFGHMLGLPHIACDGGEANQCYGRNPAQRANIMGLKNRVTRENYLPFLVAMRRLTDTRWRVT